LTPVAKANIVHPPMRNDEAVRESPTEASLAGRTKYVGSVPCRRCGGLVRYTSSCQCVTCAVSDAVKANRQRRKRLAESKPS
jgi:hypothetical protein